MRNFIVKYFVLYYHLRATALNIVARAFLIPLIIAFAVITPNVSGKFITLGALATVTLVCWFLPIAKKKFSVLRAAMVLYPLFFVTGLVFALTHTSEMGLSWYHYGLLGILTVGLWLGGLIPYISYFDLWPVKPSELGAEQLEDYNEFKKLNKGV